MAAKAARYSQGTRVLPFTIYKSSYLYIKRLLPEGITHFRKSDTF